MDGGDKKKGEEKVVKEIGETGKKIRKREERKRGKKRDGMEMVKGW